MEATWNLPGLALRGRLAAADVPRLVRVSDAHLARRAFCGGVGVVVGGACGAVFAGRVRGDGEGDHLPRLARRLRNGLALAGVARLVGKVNAQGALDARRGRVRVVVGGARDALEVGAR